ncbi:hypothetical protein ACFOHS_22960 [Jhaorihella thermophila]
MVEVWFEIPDLPPDRFREGGPDRLWEDLVQRHARGPGTVILSSEAFSRQGREPIDYADLARRLAPFEEVRVICTLRRQAELAQSVWLEVARKGRALTLRPYLNRAWTEGLCHGVSIDHERIYDRLLEGFSPDRIHLFDYEHVRRARGGLAQALLDLAGGGSVRFRPAPAAAGKRQHLARPAGILSGQPDRRQRAAARCAGDGGDRYPAHRSAPADILAEPRRIRPVPQRVCPGQRPSRGPGPAPGSPDSPCRTPLRPGNSSIATM